MKTTWEEIQKSMTETYENYTQKKLLPGDGRAIRSGPAEIQYTVLPVTGNLP